MKALFRCEKNWQKINVQRFSANFLFSKNGKCRSITYSGDFATLPLLVQAVRPYGELRDDLPEIQQPMVPERRGELRSLLCYKEQ